MNITANRLRKLIKEALTDMTKADYVGTEEPSEMRTINQVAQDYALWASSEDGRKLVALINSPENIEQASQLLDVLSMEDLKVPPDTEDYLFGLSLYIYKVGQILFKNEPKLHGLIDAIGITPETKAQGIELFNILIETLDEFNLELNYAKYELAKRYVQGILKKPTRSPDSWTDNTFSAMQNVVAPANQNANGKNLGLYLIEIGDLTYDTLKDLDEWIEFFSEFLSDTIAVIGAPAYRINITPDNEAGNYYLTYLVIASGDTNQVNQDIDNELSMIDIEMFQDGYGMVDSKWHYSNEFWSDISDPESKLESNVQQLIPPGDFEALRSFVNKSGAGIVDFEEYSAQEFNSMVPKALEIIWDEAMNVNVNSHPTLTSFAHDAGYNLVDLVNDLGYVNYTLDYIGP